ncbi:MAG TPA: GH1 family beta-glucosidase [Candidatus Dormibacteraeota bacterium]|nr:GH1 family beta-glucosidase [Candidatus Dormibacteraeota bacterium]
MSATFPPGFLWGAGAAAYQVEGAAREDGRLPSIWDTFSHTPGKTLHGDTGDVATDHYHRLEEDLDLMARLGLGAYRFSISWPRVQPEGRGRPNPAGLDFYRRLLEGLARRSIRAAATLYHWDLPQVLQDRGGWPARDTAERFGEYAALMARELGDGVALWTTLNEPYCSAWLGYGTGAHAPGLRDSGQALAATHHLLLGHARALAAVRSERPGAPVGISLNLATVRSASEAPADRAAVERLDGLQNRLFCEPLFEGRYPEAVVELFSGLRPGLVTAPGDLEAISAPVDFLGLNYYGPTWVQAANEPDPRVSGEDGHGLWVPELRLRPYRDPEWRTTAMGWPVDPQGLVQLLTEIHRRRWAPAVYVTENGAAFHDYVDPEGRVQDPERISYLASHLEAVAGAIARGVPVRGYFVWSLTDNFEWAWGYSRRFGLVFVEYGTQRRIPKTSFEWYRRVIATNAVPPAAGEVFEPGTPGRPRRPGRRSSG